MPNETIDYSDIPELDDAFFEGAIERPAQQKRVVSLRLDEETIAVFKELSPRGYTSTMAQVLQKAAAKLRTN